MKRCALFLLLVLALVGCSVGASRASALTYQDEVDLEFVLNPTISITVSDDLSISDLLPGNYGDSNIITVSASSNAVAGYTVQSTVGSSTYASSELKKDGTDNTNKFTSITSNKASLSNFSDSNWGYAWCNGTCTTESTWVSGDAGSTTSGYNGLPLYTGTGVKVVDANAPGSSTVSFKIGARAASAQVAGTYNNVINFVAVANPNPEPAKTLDQATTMQENIDCANTAANTTNTLTDTRDGQEYLVGKLADGKCWMLENLNLAGSTAIEATKSDVDASYISSFTASNNLTKSDNAIILPASDIDGFFDDNYSYVYNSGNKTSNCSDPGCYSYYSWDAATLGSGRTIFTENTDAPYSICPKGWRLPTSGDSSNNEWKRGDFYALATSYGANLENFSYDVSATFYNNAGPSTLPNFLLAGYYGYGGSFNDGGSYGYYWSSTSPSDESYARELDFYSNYVDSASYISRCYGLSVRCLRSS